MSLLFVGFGAFFGACARYGLTKLCSTLFDTMFPIGTLLSNVIAGILIGFILRSSLIKWQLPDNHKLFLTTGLLGGLSTFSTFSMDTVELFRIGRFFSASGNVILNVGLSICGVVIGMWIAEMVYAK